ncbi:AAA family ATPase [Treponema primitia]|uniref:AAA family ATPase n=1 Tax=Treponema primitia TaxID=88058 RepID=UPI0039814E4B
MIVTESGNSSGVKNLISRCRKNGEKELDLSGQGIERLPPELAELTQITVLDLGNNKITELPDFIGELVSLEYLDISHNSLQSLPDSLGKLVSLETLDLSSNLIRDIPETIKNLPSLEKLTVTSNKIENISEALNIFTTTKELTLLDHADKIITLSNKNGLTKTFFKIADNHIQYITEKLDISPIQAVFFSHFLNRSQENTILISSIAEDIHCNMIRTLQYMNDLEGLEKKKLIRCSRGNSVTYRVPWDVKNAIRKGEEFKPPDHSNLSIDKFFTIVETLFEERGDDELTFETLAGELYDLMDNNMHLHFSQRMKNIHIGDQDKVLLICFCHLFANNNDDEIRHHDFEYIYAESWVKNSIKRQFEKGEHFLLENEFIENVSSDGFGDQEAFKLTDKAKKELLGELDMKMRLGRNKKRLTLHEKLPEKKLFYNEKETQRIEQLASLLQNNNFKSIQDRLASGGMRRGFACLFYGPPGTGKTETVYQIAKKTDRDIMLVDIAETKSKWYGESEKQIKEIFNQYKAFVDSNEIAPILLFNEADAVIGKRRELGDSSRAVDQTENTIQNIILQEMENLTGILIATTNLTNNLDKAFERRFLYKIEFEKPALPARQSIWQSIIPDLSDADARELAARFEFSGGQIENIARKRTVENIISGQEPSIDRLVSFCQEEVLEKQTGRIGFGT